MARRVFPAGTVTNTTGAPLRLTFHVTSTTGRRETDLWTVDGSNNLVERIPNGVILTNSSGAYSAFAGPDDIDTLYLQPHTGAARTSILATARVASGVTEDNATYARSGRGLSLPAGWDTGWKTAKAAGSPNIANVGDSVTAGVAAGSAIPDSLIYGYPMRLQGLLAPLLGGMRALYLPIYPYSPFGGGQTSTAVSPFSNTDNASAAEYPSGVGAVQGPTTLTTWNYTITVGNHPVTGAAPTGMDLLTVDFVASQTWQYRVDGGSATTITTSASASNGNATAILRRTPITMSAGAHSVQVGQQSAANTLFILGAVFYYGTTGLGYAVQGIPSWRAIDYAGSAGNGQGTSGTNAQMPDRIKPWSGIQDANNISGNSFPWRPDLGIIALGLNDRGFRSHPVAYERALTRYVHAFRAGNKNCSVLMVACAEGNLYSDNPGSAFNEYAVYKRIMAQVADIYHCGFIDFDTIWEPDPIAAGMLLSGNAHPTGNGKGAGGGDGHLDMATRIAAIL